MSTGDVDVSIVLECDNLVVGGTERAEVMVRELSAQMAELDSGVELIVVYDEDVVAPGDIKELLERGIGTQTRYTLLPASGARYYEQKNAGAERATGDIVLFVDSDCVPEAGWLREMVAPFSDPDLDVLSGGTYTEGVTVAEKAFSLTWNFEIRTLDAPIRPVTHFNANTVAFRRATFEHHHFPKDARFRGQCQSLAEELIAAGIPIALNPLARIGHPPPTGVRYITERALCQGHDRLLGSRLRGRSDSFVRSLHVLGSDLKRSASRIVRYRRRVDLRAWQVPAAILVTAWYHVVSCAGWNITRIRPSRVPWHCRV